jgi:hypothetical protein
MGKVIKDTILATDIVLNESTNSNTLEPMLLEIRSYLLQKKPNDIRWFFHRQ